MSWRFDIREVVIEALQYCRAIVVGLCLAMLPLLSDHARANGKADANAAPDVECTGSAWDIAHGGKPKSTALQFDIDIAEPGDSAAKTVCRVLSHYAQFPNVILVDRYAPSADVYRDRGRNCSGEQGCDTKRDWQRQVNTSEMLVSKNKDGKDQPSDDNLEALAGRLLGLKGQASETSSQDFANQFSSWDAQDAVLVEFEWGLCGWKAIEFEKARWRETHLNQSARQSDPGLFVAQTEPWLLGSDKGGAKDDGACLESITVRSTLRERWANYIRVDLVEVETLKPANNRCVSAGKFLAKETYVDRVEWKSHYFNQLEWLVLARDHLIERVEQRGYSITREGARLLKNSPFIRYGSRAATIERYRWPDPYVPHAPYDTNAELLVSFGPEARLALNRGPLYEDFWGRARARYIADQVTRSMRSGLAAPLVQNDWSKADPSRDPPKESVYVPRQEILPRLGPTAERVKDTLLCYD